MKNIDTNITPSKCKMVLKGLALGTLILTGFSSLQAQETEYAPPTWWFGAAGAANINFYEGTTQQLNGDFTVPGAFHDGNGIGLYLAPLVEFRPPASKWGAMLQLGYDSRKGNFDQISTFCNCPADLSTRLSYFTVEPSLRLAPFNSDFYLFAGPRLAFNMDQSFTYKQGINPEFPDQVANPDVKGDFDNIQKMLVSMQIGAGYDIQLSADSRPTKTVLSPFISYHPYFGQDPRTVEAWNVTTIRAGAALKFGRGRKVLPQEAMLFPDNAVAADANVRFSVISPENIPTERRVSETFPLRNYVFFDLGSTKIPERYVLLQKNQVADFKEDQLEVLEPKRLTGRSDREMVVYYNLLNILGDRMNKNPSSAITLVGSSEKGPEDGKAMAQSISNYLISVFGINASRISIEGRNKPENPSEQPGGTLELKLLREGDRRVSIESQSPALLMEFETGNETSLKPVEIKALLIAPVDSYVTFNVEGAEKAFSSWSLELKDEQGKGQNFGPYTDESVSIPGKSILGNKSKGNYKVNSLVSKTSKALSLTLSYQKMKIKA